VSGKAKIIISDLHIGAGHVEFGNALEDFNVDENFVAFLDTLVDRSEAEDLDMELIVAGDMFEFLQVPHVDNFEPRRHYAAREYASSSEEDSIRKTRIIAAGHPLVFQALHSFMKPAGPWRRITIIKGNHDVNLHWNGVRTILRDSMRATGELYGCLHFESRRVHREGLWVEHGNQYTEKVNRFDDFEDPRDPNRREQLALPAGSRFVFNCLNALERERYWVDGVKPITAMIWYSLVFDFPFAFRAFLGLLREIPSLVWESLPWGRGDEGVLGRREQEDLESAITDPGAVVSLGRRYGSHPFHQRRFAQSLECISEWDHLTAEESDGEEIGSLEMGALRRARAIQASVGGALEKVAVARIAESKVGQSDVEVVVFGHTHDAFIRSLPGGGFYVNAGTWVWHRDFSGETRETWRAFWEEPERYMTDRRLSYVWVDYDPEGIPHPQLLEFEREAPDFGVGEEVRSWWERFLVWLKGLGF